MTAGPDARDVDLVRGLVAIPSVSRQEGEAVEWLVVRMAERGFRAFVDDAGNAVGEIGEGARHVVLLGHVDTVPGEITVRIEDGHLVGRGAVDAKGPLAAFICAASVRVPDVRVSVIGAVEEESPTSAGARFAASLPAPDWCVVGEPSGWDGVTIAYKGRLALRLVLERGARHGAAPGPTCAEEGLDLWARIRESAVARAPGASGFAGVDARLEGMRAGDGDGLVERAELRVGFRLPPGVIPQDIATEARSLAAAHAGEARVSVEVIGVEDPVRTSRTSALARAFVRAVDRAGGQTTFKVKSGTSDMNILAPAWRCPIVAYGPGDSRYDHTPLERLALADYARSIAVLRDVLAQAAAPVP